MTDADILFYWSCQVSLQTVDILRLALTWCRIWHLLWRGLVSVCTWSMVLQAKHPTYVASQPRPPTGSPPWKGSCKGLAPWKGSWKGQQPRRAVVKGAFRGSVGLSIRQVGVSTITTDSWGDQHADGELKARGGGMLQWQGGWRRPGWLRTKVSQ